MFLVCFGRLLVSACVLLAAVACPASVPKNIIFFIGDGMGLTCITAGKIAKGSLSLEKFPYTGLVTTFAAKDMLITDSAASATALATGTKTMNAIVSLKLQIGDNNADPRVDTLETVLEIAEQKGLATGLVATSSITHATPACFAAHVVSRGLEPEIARQLADKSIEVLLGGGRKFFLPQSEAGSGRQDNLNVLDVFQSAGYAVLTSPEAFKKLNFQNVERVLGLFSDGGMANIPERSPTLPEMTQAALEILSRDADGFFLMVEGSQIDWKAHDNNAEGMINEMLEFDSAIEVGLEFAQRHPETLVLVTADHETGGAAIVGGSLAKKEVEVAFSTGGHTAAMVPVFAMGPGAENFTGVMDNTRIGARLIEFVKGYASDNH